MSVKLKQYTTHTEAKKTKTKHTSSIVPLLVFNYKLINYVTCVFLPQHTHTVFGKGSSFLAFPSWSCRPKDPKAAELDFRGFLMTKVSTTWLHHACCLRKSGQWPAVTRKRTRPQHFKTSEVRKCAKKLFWLTLTKSLPLHTPPCPTSPPPPRSQLRLSSSALYMLPACY